MDIKLLVKVTSRAWSLKILSLLHEGVPGRQATLLTAAQASRTAFRLSLAHLIDLGLLERNPGHGHPLRPEYRLTPQGISAASMAHRIIKASEKSDGLSIVKKSWTVPVLALTARPQHFIDIKSSLPSITDRALSQSLTALQNQHWLSRDVDVTQRPLRPTYRAIEVGGIISKAVNIAPN